MDSRANDIYTHFFTSRLIPIIEPAWLIARLRTCGASSNFQSTSGGMWPGLANSAEGKDTTRRQAGVRPHNILQSSHNSSTHASNHSLALKSSPRNSSSASSAIHTAARPSSEAAAQSSCHLVPIPSPPYRSACCMRTLCVPTGSPRFFLAVDPSFRPEDGPDPPRAPSSSVYRSTPAALLRSRCLI